MRSRAFLAAVAALALLASPALAGPDPEDPPSEFDIGYPGFFTVAPRAENQVVARVRFENVGGSDSAGLDACVVLPRGFRDAKVNGRRERVRVTRRGSKVCWFVGSVAPGETGRAVVRATAPRRTGRYVTKVRLIAVEDALVPGEAIGRRGGVQVRR